MLLAKNLLKTHLFALSLILMTANSALAQIQFTSAQSIESQYFTIQIQSDVDPIRLLHSLDIGASNQILVNGRIIQKSLPQDELAAALDDLYIRCSEILDMKTTPQKTQIKIFRTHEQLSALFYSQYGGKLPDTGSSYYSTHTNTIYISEEGFKLGIIGHEMGHVLINNYFVNTPPGKIQEVLAGYVEFQLRKHQ